MTVTPLSGRPLLDQPSVPPARPTSQIVESMRSRPQEPVGAQRSPIATGFDLLDRVLDGGLRRHDLMLLGGQPGVGKSIVGLQIARHAARSGRAVVYACYEHDAATLLGRLLMLELGEAATPASAADIDRLRGQVIAATAGYADLDELIAVEPLLAQALTTLEGYADRLFLVEASGRHTTIAALEALITDTGLHRDGLLVIDYLQKVAVQPDPGDENEKVTRAVEELKDLALRHDLACLALVAADRDALAAPRVRLHDLRGSSSLAYECDVAVVMNDKHRAVARVHLAYDGVKAESYRRQVVFSVEKNRGGPAMVDIEFEKDFARYRLHPRGTYVAERLEGDRLTGD